MRVVVGVGSANPSKIAGVEKAFKRYFGDVVVKGFRVESGVARQPFSLGEILRGARNRALRALEACGECAFGVGVEAGIFAVDGFYMDTQAAVVVKRGGAEGVGFSSSFAVPPFIVEEILSEGLELEEAVDRHFGTRNVGEGEGFVGLLTRGVVVREDLAEQAVLMALIPVLNEELYFRKSR
ncbi:inosine/xanthosine triphosphatase [Thermofilum pendens]|uniref:Probable inosine/xanthosine triphosphatase n=1 Tax=Thermofilum pendens (strain DSM 2475 / Hrk 5) TaxID=368408 RepID=A1S0P5_THEPD|nr:inosine/xanthosine triphosphatase [Thermofilum pendens]ABL79025.1 protein of unknown function DUF84 [Thermofilum pendens Hrk 5]